MRAQRSRLSRTQRIAANFARGIVHPPRNAVFYAERSAPCKQVSCSRERTRQAPPLSPPRSSRGGVGGGALRGAPWRLDIGGGPPPPPPPPQERGGEIAAPDELIRPSLPTGWERPREA